jgi:tetratricopeptide (TPR) repeat protein
MNLISLKRFEEAEEQLQEARRLDPTSRNIAVYLIVNYYVAGRYDTAIEQANAALELEPRLSGAWMFMSRAYEQKGMYPEAVSAYLQRQSVIQPEFVEELRDAFERSGIRGFWEKQIDLMQRQGGQNSMSCTLEVTTRYALLGEIDRALDIIEKDFRYGGTCWNFIFVEPQLDSLRTNERFQAVLREAGF